MKATPTISPINPTAPVSCFASPLPIPNSMKDIKRILVAVKDPGARSQPAIVKAGEVARAVGARLELFHADCRSDYVRALRTPIPNLLRIETKNDDARLHQMEAL